MKVEFNSFLSTNTYQTSRKFGYLNEARQIVSQRCCEKSYLLHQKKTVTSNVTSLTTYLFFCIKTGLPVILHLKSFTRK